MEDTSPMIRSEPSPAPVSRSGSRPMVVRAVALALISLTLLIGAGHATTAGAEPEPAPPPSTFNVFWPEERPMSDCFGALQRPNCGSEARGGWAQTTVFVLLVAGLAFIGWRITLIVRENRREPAASTARGGDGDDRAP